MEPGAGPDVQGSVGDAVVDGRQSIRLRPGRSSMPAARPRLIVLEGYLAEVDTFSF